MKRALLAVLGLAWGIVLPGCSAAQKTRSLAVAAEQREAELELKAMAEAPRPLRRPVLLLAGWNQPPSNWDRFRTWLESSTCGCDREILCPDLRGAGGLAAAVEKVLALCEGRGEVDVIAHSAGGLVAREAARESHGEKRLRIARLFAIATPHKGSSWGRFWSLVPDPLQAADCNIGSPFLASLDGDPSSSSMPISTFWAEGDIVVTRESAQAVGNVHHAYSRRAGILIHRRCAADPRLARDVIAGLLK